MLVKLNSTCFHFQDNSRPLTFALNEQFVTKLIDAFESDFAQVSQIAIPYRLFCYPRKVYRSNLMCMLSCPAQLLNELEDVLAIICKIRTMLLWVCLRIQSYQET